MDVTIYHLDPPDDGNLYVVRTFNFDPWPFTDGFVRMKGEVGIITSSGRWAPGPTWSLVEDDYKRLAELSDGTLAVVHDSVPCHRPVTRERRFI